VGDHAKVTPVFEPITNVAELFGPVLADAPDREALVTRRARLSYRELDEACARGTRVLQDLGVRPGERVAASLPNDADIVVAFHAAMRLGAVWVGINHVLAAPEKAYLLGDSGASLLLTDDSTAVSLEAHRASLPGLRSVCDVVDWQRMEAHATPLREVAPVDPDAPAGLAYTSGTTGRPKGAIHSQRNLLLPGAVLVATRGWGADLRKGDCLPLTILNMMVLTTLLTPQAGGTAVIMDQLHAGAVAGWIERERVTVWNGPPALLHSLAGADDIRPGALRSLREAWSGGSALPEDLRRRFADRFDVPVIGTYGLSEAPTVVSIDPPDGTHVDGASGRVLPHLDVRVLDDDGAPVERGEVGELCLAPAAEGPFAGAYRPPLGYWDQPDASEALLVGDVVHTGDVGTVDGEGWLAVRDRKNLVILRGGANVYPAEVERVLQAVPGIADAAVSGVPDERLGERVVAAVELDDGCTLTSERIAERCRTQLAGYKVPERIVIVDELPRNAMGKIDRKAVTSALGG
jgi:long-chain acyl-CoA synthetase